MGPTGSPSTVPWPPRASSRTASTRSRVSRIVSRDPTPRTNRPSEASCTVAAAMASVGAVRARRGTTPVARRISRVAAAKPVSVEKASRAAISGVKMDSYPVSRRGLTVLCFNFRGVMGSGGEYDHGRGELRDVAAAIGRVRQDVAGPTVLVGWSFGAWIALRQAVADSRVAALVLVAIPLARGSGARPLPTLGDLGGLRTPVLLVAGDRDGVCPVGGVR